MKQRFRQVSGWARRNKHSIYKFGGIGLGVLLLVQLLYPGDRLPLFASVDGVGLSAVTKLEAAKKLNQLSSDQRVNVRLGSASEDYDAPKAGDIGVSVKHDERAESLGYPWYWRIIPTSMLWYGLVQGDGTAAYAFDEAKAEAYVTAKMGAECVVPAKDASLKQSGDTLTLVPAVAGGTCDKKQAVSALKAAKPELDKVAAVTIPVTVTAPTVGDSEAQRLADELNANSRGGVELKVVDKRQTVTQKDVLSWLTFKSEGSDLTFTVDPKKADGYLSKSVTPAVSRPAGVTKVSTLDFAETSRNEGTTGQTLSVDATLGDVASVLRGDKETATAVVAPLPPKVEYTRSYTKTSNGIAAQIRFFDEDNPGVFGVSFIELGGQGLSASHNSGRQFVTASTYKLFVAFSTLKRVDGGQMKWDDANIAGGRNLSTCFDDMIVKSDNACAEALIKKIGAKELNADIKSLGLGSTAFRSDNNVTTADDLASYLTQLEKGTMPIKPESRDRLLAAMKRNVYRQGVPAGASGPVADKVGFLWGLLHDATIVYSPKGTYVLAVMTDGSSWGAIAELTRKIEALR